MITQNMQTLEEYYKQENDHSKRMMNTYEDYVNLKLIVNQLSKKRLQLIGKQTTNSAIINQEREKRFTLLSNYRLDNAL